MLNVFQIAGLVTIVAGIILLLKGLTESMESMEAERFGLEDIDMYRNREYQEFDTKEFDTKQLERERRTDFGGVVMIGPIPIVFGNNSKAVNLAIILTMLLMVMFFLMFFVLPYVYR